MFGEKVVINYKIPLRIKFTSHSFNALNAKIFKNLRVPKYIAAFI